MVFRHWEDERFGAGFHHRNVAFSGIGFLDLESTEFLARGKVQRCICSSIGDCHLLF